jgi:hypothetical protein
MCFLRRFQLFPEAMWGCYYEISLCDLSCLSSTLGSLCLCVPRVVNYHLLTYLREVAFRGCNSIMDVSCFRYAEIVKFFSCRNVSNVNSLKNVKELVLGHCNGATDVSELRTVKKMEIRDCHNIQDLTGLSIVYTLAVANAARNLLFSLNQNTVLDLSGYGVQ